MNVIKADSIVQMAYLICLIFIFLGSMSLASRENRIPFRTSVNEIYETLVRLKVSKIEDAVQLFDQKYFQNGNFALVFNTNSIQPASHQYPRVIFFGEDAKLIASFNHQLGDTKDFEFIEFDEIKKKWNFREIRFLKNKPVLSEPNMRGCVQCHGGNKAKPRLEYMNIGSNIRVDIKTATDFFLKKTPYWDDFVRNSNGDPIYMRFELFKK